MIAVAVYGGLYGGEGGYIEGSEQDDLEKIDSLLPQLSPDEQQRSKLKEAWWQEAQKLLSDNWPAVQALATKLLKREALDGKEVHSIIWQTIGHPDADWRLQALNIKRGSVK